MSTQQHMILYNRKCFQMVELDCVLIYQSLPPFDVYEDQRELTLLVMDGVWKNASLSAKLLFFIWLCLQLL